MPDETPTTTPAEGEKKAKPKTKTPGAPNFLPDMLGQKVLARLVDGRPINATLEAFNAYELLFDLGHGKKMMVFKHAVSSIEFTKSPKE
ncbi:MAG: hypothetical protein WBK88_04140 [Methanothrix sp.]